MLLISRKRPQIGDVIEIGTPLGLAFAQFTHKHHTYGALLRVLPGLYASRPESLSELSLTEPQFSTFFPLGSACSKGIVQIVGNEAISESLRMFPTFRTSVKGQDGRWGPWWLWDGHKEWKIGQLQPGMEALPPRAVINDTLLIERIVSGWRHENWS